MHMYLSTYANFVHATTTVTYYKSALAGKRYARTHAHCYCKSDSALQILYESTLRRVTNV